MQLFKFLIIFTFSGLTYANNCKFEEQSDSDCCEFQKSISQTRTSRLQTFDKSVCTLSVYNSDANTSFRRFGFASDGQVSIFIQPGGNKMKSNSSQSFLIYPFGENPTVSYSSADMIQVQSGSGQRWTFNEQTALPNSVEGCNIKVSSNFSLKDSGVKILSCKKHLVIETPIDVGGEYIAYPDKPLTVRDPNQKTCQIKNSDLYEYKKSGASYKDKLGRYFNQKLKFRSNYEMGQRLKQLCPNIDVSMLVKDGKGFQSVKDSSDGKRARDILNGRVNN